MNLFRHAVAPLAEGGPFFSSVLKTGGHLASLRALAIDRTADVAAIDCVTFAFVREHLPELAGGVREIGSHGKRAGPAVHRVERVAGRRSHPPRRRTRRRRARASRACPAAETEGLRPPPGRRLPVDPRDGGRGHRARLSRSSRNASARITLPPVQSARFHDFRHNRLLSKRCQARLAAAASTRQATGTAE